MRIFVVGNEERTKAARAVQFASNRDRYFFISDDKKPLSDVPGNTPEHNVQLGELACVFSFSVWKNKLIRHLSIRAQFGFPQKEAALTAAHFFGFTGATEIMGKVSEAPEDWNIGVDGSDLVITQEIGDYDGGRNQDELN